MAAVYTGERTFLDPVFGGLRSGCSTGSCGSTPSRGQDWKAYAKSLIIFSLAGWLLLYFILRTQTLWNFTGLNPQHFHSAPWNVTFNTTSSFVTNTNWQYYGGETTMSYFSQMAGLTVQNFLSAAVGIVVAVALIRGIIGRSGKSLGNFWQDLVRTVAVRAAADLVRGRAGAGVPGLDPELLALPELQRADRLAHTIAMGPVASQEAIKELGTNGGGFFNVNSAHPFENPSGFTNLVEMLAVLIIPAALVFTYGRMAGKRRQGYAIYATMMIMFLGAVRRRVYRRGARLAGAARGGPAHRRDPRLGRRQHGGQGAALRDRRLGAVRRRHDGHLVRRGQQCDRVVHRDRRRGPDGEPVGERGDLRRRRHGPVLDPAVRDPGGVHRRADGRPHAGVSGQEDRGAGDQAGRARAADHAADRRCSRPRWRSRARPGARRSQPPPAEPQGFSETFYAYLSQANNNGSAFAGYTGFIQPNAGNLGSHGITFANLLGGFDDDVRALTRRSCSRSRSPARSPASGSAPPGLGTMRTDNPTFVVLLIGVIVLVGALTFFPALLLGPIVQGLTGHLY